MKNYRLRLFALIFSMLFFITACGAAEQKQASPTAAQESIQPTATPAAADDAAEPASENEKGMPYLLNDLEGSPLVFSELKGKVIILNFFTTWCTYCKIEMPDLLKLQEKYGEELQVILIHVPDGETEEDARKFLKDNGFDSLRMVEDSTGMLAYYFQLEGYPLSVAIDREGYLLYYQPGMLTYEQMEKIVQEGVLTAPDASAE